MTEPDWKPVGDSTEAILCRLTHEGDQLEYEDLTWHQKFDRLLSMIYTEQDKLYKSLHCKDT